MSTIVGIVKNPDACASVGDSWPRSGAAGPELIVSPPVSLIDVGRRASVIIMEIPDDRGLRQALLALRPVAAPQTALVCTSSVVPLEVVRTVVGAGPSLFRAVIPLGLKLREGIAAIAAETGTAAEAVERVEAALAPIGTVEIVTEDALDAIHALGVGGAAFLCAALTGLEDGAVDDGLPRDVARAFAHHTLLATALLLRDHDGSPADLKDQVASPGGTTIAALACLEDAGVRGAYLRAVERTAAEVRTRRDAARSGMVE